MAPSSRHADLGEISLAAPAYNEAESIQRVVVHWMEYLSKGFAPGMFEVVICNDGSKDATAEVLAQLQSQYPALKVVTHKKNQGAAAALIGTFCIRYKSRGCGLPRET
jgi:glycosyltransferase involved in cell wall biosynthesis